MEDRDPPPPYFGDHPQGAHWSAVRSEGTGADDEADYTVMGRELRVMWDEGAGPLWAEDGGLPGDPEWLQRALGLSDTLSVHLVTWLNDMTAHQSSPPAEWQQRRQQLDERGRALAELLQDEVGARYRVRYHA